MVDGKVHEEGEGENKMAKKMGGNADWMNKLTDTVTGKKDGQTGGSRRRRMRKGKSGKTLRRKKMTMKQRQQQQRQQRQQQQRQRRRH